MGNNNSTTSKDSVIKPSPSFNKDYLTTDLNDEDLETIKELEEKYDLKFSSIKKLVNKPFVDEWDFYGISYLLKTENESSYYYFIHYEEGKYYNCFSSVSNLQFKNESEINKKLKEYLKKCTPNITDEEIINTDFYVSDDKNYGTYLIGNNIYIVMLKKKSIFIHEYDGKRISIDWKDKSLLDGNYPPVRYANDEKTVAIM